MDGYVTNMRTGSKVDEFQLGERRSFQTLRYQDRALNDLLKANPRRSMTDLFRQAVDKLIAEEHPSTDIRKLATGGAA